MADKAAHDWGVELMGVSAGWDGYPPPVSGRSFDPGSPFFMDPTVAAIIDSHPTGIAILVRGDELHRWECDVSLYDNYLKKQSAVRRIPGLLIVAALVALAVFLATGWLPVAFIGLLCGSMIPATRFWSNSQRRPAWPGDRPVPLVYSGYSPDDNAKLVCREPVTDFRSVCACPGCGQVCVHGFANWCLPWANAVRRCAACGREWACA